jgi:hypothetical protein
MPAHACAAHLQPLQACLSRTAIHSLSPNPGQLVLLPTHRSHLHTFLCYAQLEEQGWGPLLDSVLNQTPADSQPMPAQQPLPAFQLAPLLPPMAGQHPQLAPQAVPPPVAAPPVLPGIMLRSQAVQAPAPAFLGNHAVQPLSQPYACPIQLHRLAIKVRHCVIALGAVCLLCGLTGAGWLHCVGCKRPKLLQVAAVPRSCGTQRDRQCWVSYSCAWLTPKCTMGGGSIERPSHTADFQLLAGDAGPRHPFGSAAGTGDCSRSGGSMCQVRVHAHAAARCLLSSHTSCEATGEHAGVADTDRCRCARYQSISISIQTLVSTWRSFFGNDRIRTCLPPTLAGLAAPTSPWTCTSVGPQPYPLQPPRPPICFTLCAAPAPLDPLPASRCCCSGRDSWLRQTVVPDSLQTRCAASQLPSRC